MSDSAPTLLHVFSTFAAGGPQVRTVRMMEAFGADYSHVVVAMDGCTDARSLLSPQTPVRFLEAPPKAGTFATTRRLRKLLAGERFDLLLTYNFGAMDAVLAARTLGIGHHLHAEDGFLPDEAGGEFKRRRELYRRWLLSKTAGVIVPSRTLQRLAVERWRLSPDHVHWVPNGLDVGSFVELPPDAPDREAVRAELGIPSDGLVLGSCGHLRPEKNVGRLLDTAARLVPKWNVHVLVLGDGVERAQLEARAQEEPLRGRVHFVGHREDPRPWYRAMDVFAITSDTEQMPVALLEAMASALPVVSTDVGDVRAMLPDTQGQTVVRAQGETTPFALVGACEYLFESKSMRRTFGKKNLAAVRERFTFEAMLAAYRGHYAAAMSPGSRTPGG